VLVLSVQEARTDAEHDIGGGEHLATGQRRERQRMAVVERSAAVRAHDDRRLESFGQSAQRLGCASGDGATTNVQDGPFGTGERVGYLVRSFDVGQDWLVALDGRDQIHFRGRLQDVWRHLEADWPRPAAAQVAHGQVDQARNVGWAFGSGGPLGERTEDVRLLGDLVQHAETAADGVRGDLAGDAQHA
jgi:hypothetical protein